MSIDPLAHSYPGNSPYVFAANNPTTLVDALGMWPDWPDHPPATLWERIQYGFYKTANLYKKVDLQVGRKLVEKGKVGDLMQ